MGQLQSTGIAAEDGPPFSGPIAEAIFRFVRGAVKGGKYYCAENPGDGTFNLLEIADSAISGGLAALGAKVAQMLANEYALDGGQTIGSKVSEDAKAIQRGAGAVGGCVAGVFYQIIKNLLCERRLEKEDFLKMMAYHPEVEAENLWDFMCSKGIIIDGKVVITQLSPSLSFPSHVECYEKAIQYMIEVAPVYCIIKDVIKTASGGAIIGKVVTDEDIDKIVDTIRSIGKDCSRKVLQQIAWGGTLEIQIFCNIYNAQVVVQHSDGKTEVFDPRDHLPSAERKQLHLSYDQEHYQPADKDGKIHSTDYPETYGNCLYNSLAFHMVKGPKEKLDAKVRDIKVNIADAFITISECMYNIQINDLQRGGDDLGAGRPELRRFELKKQDQVKIFAVFAEEHPELRQQVQDALRELQDMPIKQLRQMKDQAKTQGSASTHRKGSHYIHALTDELVGLLSVDVRSQDSSDFSRGKVRLLFDIEKQKYYTIIFDHDYNNVIRLRGVRVISDNSNLLTLLRQTDKCVDKAVERLENLQKVNHLRELEREGITVNKKERKVLLATDSSANPILTFSFKHNYVLYYNP